jgi:hypothetical protein
MLEGLLGLIHLILFVWAFLSIWRSSASGMSKLMWSFIVFVFPLIGLLVWFFMGPKKS